MKSSFRQLCISLLFGVSLPFDSIAAPTLSESATISLLTCSPGEELYQAFGHSAISVQDPELGIDRVYNYGTFDFNTPNFYLKFIQGKLEYSLSVSRLKHFIYVYALNGRSVISQEFNLNQAERQQLFEFLAWNHLAENRNYQYDFFFDNCATRIRDIAEYECGMQMVYPELENDEPISFRELLDPYIEARPWTDFGIDLILGLPADRHAALYEFAFLPDHLSEILAKSRFVGDDGAKMVLKPAETLARLESPLVFEEKFLTPLRLMICLLILIFFNSLTGIKIGKELRFFDYLIFGTTGLAGLFFLFCWFGTDHQVLPMNMNMLWAMPLNLIVLFTIGRPSMAKFNQFYFSFIAGFAILTLATFQWLPQQLHLACLPILIIVAVRSIYRLYWLNRNTHGTIRKTS